MNAKNYNDGLVLKELKMGNLDAFNTVFDYYYGDILHYVYRLSNSNMTMAEDVTQKVFMNFWTHRNNHNTQSQIKPLLLRMARNAWIDESKKEATRKARQFDESKSTTMVEESPNTNAEKSELKSAVDKAVDLLEEPVREVFVLIRYHNLKYAEASELLNISVKTVEARMSRAHKELRITLKDFI